MAAFERIADDIIKQSLLRRQLGEQRVQRALPKAQPAVPQPDYTPAIRQIFAGAGQAAGSIVKGVMTERDDKAVDRTRIELIKEAFPIPTVKARKGDIEVDLPMPAKRIHKIGSEVETHLREIGDIKRSIKEADDFKIKANLRSELRAANEKLKAKREELNSIAPGKSDLKEIIQRRLEADAIRARTTRIPKEKAPTEETPDQMRERFKKSYKDISADLTNKGIPAAPDFKLGLNTLDNLKPDKDIISIAAPEIQNIMTAAATARAKNIFDEVRQWDQQDINRILLNDELSDGEKRQRLARGMLDRSGYLDKEQARDLYSNNFGTALVARSKVQPRYFSSLEGYKLFINNVKKAGSSAMTEEEKEAFEDEVEWRAKNIVNNWAGSLKKLGVDVLKTNFGDDAVFGVELTNDTKKKLLSGIDDSGDKFRKNFISFVTKNPELAVDAPVKEGEAREAIRTMAGPKWEFMVNIARANGWLPPMPDYKNQDVQKILKNNFLGNKWESFYGIIKMSLPTGSSKREARPGEKGKSGARAAGFPTKSSEYEIIEKSF